jgi:hypothetical protein
MLSAVVLWPLISPLSKFHWFLSPLKADQSFQTVDVEFPKPKKMIATIPTASTAAHNTEIKIRGRMADLGGLAGDLRKAGVLEVGGCGTTMDCWHTGQLIWMPA